MSGSPYQALELALALLRAPAQVALIRQRPLPPDVLTLIRLAVGDAAALAMAAAASGEPPDRLTEAAVLFLQQLLFADGADSYRVLGVAPDAPQDRIKAHHHWLVRWLHPDRRPDGWEVVYMSRVNRAWKDLRNTAQRRAYDDTRAATPPVAVATTASTKIPLRPARTRPTYLSAHTVRRLPIYVLSGIAVVAVAGLGLQYWAQQMPDSTPITAAAVLPVGRPQPVMLAGVAKQSLPAASQQPQARGKPAPRQAIAPSPKQAAPTPAPQTPDTAPEPRRLPALLASTIDTPPLPSPPLAAGPRAKRARVAEKPPTPAPPPQARGEPASAPRQTTAAPPPEPPAPTPAPQTPDTAPEVAHQPVPSAMAAEAAATTPPSPPTTPPQLEHAARALPERLEDAYRRGDLAALLLLFAPDIQTEHGGYVPTAGVYQALFATSLQRKITLRDIDWQFNQANHATGRGQFEIAVVPRGETVPRQAHGVIFFDVVGHPDGRARLAGLRFEGNI